MPPRKKEKKKGVESKGESAQINQKTVTTVISETDNLLAEKPDQTSIPIVGIGASAGGLAAFEAFLSQMPATTEPGIAFVLVQHLAPDHKSILTDLIRHFTRMQVFEVVDGMVVQANCAYIIPPNRDMAILNGRLQLLEPTSPRGMRLPIDFFFRSLAHDQREKAICIVLSGTGSDGTLGVRAVKSEGGMTMVQNPETAEYDGMPRSAIATGLVDYVLPPEKMPAQLLAYAHHAFRKKNRQKMVSTPTSEDMLAKICILLRDQTGHDFSQYKQNTLVRRVERRMAVNQIERMDDYLLLLRNSPPEAQALFRDLLIGVTNFFRDPEAFEILEKEVIPKIFAGKSPGAAVRFWVCGCSTGEEAYSLAILVLEHLEFLKQTFKVQIFSTDIDPQSIELARIGVYPASIASDISSDRLERFFIREPDAETYRIQKIVRDLLVFSEQDVIKDPPFSKLDLISCRNLLIYLNGELQKKLVPLFHYALNPGGVLFLGTSETVGEFAALFTQLSRRWKIYQREDDAVSSHRPTIAQFSPILTNKPTKGFPASPADRIGQTNLSDILKQSLLAHFARTGVLINTRGEILHIYGKTGKYLELAEGNASLNILTTAREGLRQPLMTALQKAVAKKSPISVKGIRVRTNGDFIFANITMTQAVDPSGIPIADLLLVVLEEDASLVSVHETETAAEQASGISPTIESKRIAELEMELKAKEEYLQNTLEEMETSNEELKSTNEEMQSVNEELQSTNEELETSKEELQSVNEELATVNSELQAKVSDLSRANNDMNNLLAGTGIATIFVDLQMNIVRYTPTATDFINLIPTDIGRPISHIVSNLVAYDGHLLDEIKAVLDDLMPREAEVITKSGLWYEMRIRPYRTLDNVIEGAVVTFTNISRRKNANKLLEDRERELYEIFKAASDGFIILEAAADNADKFIGYRFILVNDAFEQMTGISNKMVCGKMINEVCFGSEPFWINAIKQMTVDTVPKNDYVDQPSTSKRFHYSIFYPGESKERVCIILNDSVCRE